MQNKILEEAKSSKVHKHSNKHENDLQEIIINSIERSKQDYMITVSVETRVYIGYSENTPIERIHIMEKPKNAPCVKCVKKGQNLYSHFNLC